MNTTLSLIALALAGTLAVHAQEPAPAPEGGRGERRGGERAMPPEVVKEFDKDGDGKLNADEAKAAREARQAKAEEARKKMLEKYDADKDGKLSPEERTTMRTELEAKRKALVEKYDADKDGKLSPTEIKAAKDAGEEVPEFRPMGGGRRGEGAPGGEGRPNRRGQGGGEKPAPPAGE
ncbi:EF-hand domain-containing protein [Luteolibacter arcticus]|uniref:EF-hand domain-containing protein n=1 Tax=Luteolibacter arcticus TaxID=1581411 RepID=A0ABT3GR58_9BACT|nr:EF-hand domain-containing protein [Luteolibacter arcticus]MCW1926008.1 EF-hand domain-containing protein [Luteolibacter arcticus]